MLLAGESLTKALLVLGCLQNTLVVVSGQPAAGDTKCAVVDGKPGCVCDHPDGRIDLTGLANDDGTARYTDLVDPNQYKYSYNPCNPFSASGECTNVFMCQKDKSIADTYYDIADAGTEEIYYSDNNQIYLYYTASSNRYTRVYLQCDTGVTGNPVWDVKGDSQGQTLYYVFTMKHSKVCPGGGGGEPDSVAGPVGLVLIFLLLGVLVAYFVIGAVIMKFKFQKTGTDIIPNKGIWLAIPLLIKDGFMFVFSPCVSAIKNRGYSKA